MRSWASLLVIVLGAVLYVVTDDGFQVLFTHALSEYLLKYMVIILMLLLCVSGGSLFVGGVVFHFPQY